MKKKWLSIKKVPGSWEPDCDIPNCGLQYTTAIIVGGKVCYLFEVQGNSTIIPEERFCV